MKEMLCFLKANNQIFNEKDDLSTKNKDDRPFDAQPPNKNKEQPLHNDNNKLPINFKT